MPHGDAALGDYLNGRAIECAGFSQHRCPREAPIHTVAAASGANSRILQEGRENVMKNLLFFTAAALLLVESSTVAFAIGDSVFTRTDKWSGSAQREVWGPPQPQAAAVPGCHNVRVRIGTHNGHAVYQARQVCG